MMLLLASCKNVWMMSFLGSSHCPQRESFFVLEGGRCAMYYYEKIFCVSFKCVVDCLLRVHRRN